MNGKEHLGKNQVEKTVPLLEVSGRRYAGLIADTKETLEEKQCHLTVTSQMVPKPDIEKNRYI